MNPKLHEILLWRYQRLTLHHQTTPRPLLHPWFHWAPLHILQPTGTWLYNPGPNKISVPLPTTPTPTPRAHCHTQWDRLVTQSKHRLRLIQELNICLDIPIPCTKSPQAYTTNKHSEQGGGIMLSHRLISVGLFLRVLNEGVLTYSSASSDLI